MIFYEAKVKYKSIEVLPSDGEMKSNLTIEKDSEYGKRNWRETISDINRNLGAKCAFNEDVSVFIWNAKEGLLDIILACGLEVLSFSDCEEFLKDYFMTNFRVENVEILDPKEISVKKFNQLGDRGDTQGYIKRWRGASGDVGTDYFDNRLFKIREIMIPEKKVQKNLLLKSAEKIMADKTFVEELQRIYANVNKKKYYGNPVHYKITATNGDTVQEIVNVLVTALYGNKRLLSRRVTWLSDIEEGCYTEDDVEHIFQNAMGGTVVIDMSGTDENHGNYASSYQRVVEFFELVIKKYQVNTLCIFVELTEHSGFTKVMVSKLQEEIDIIEIKEGYGDKHQAGLYFKNLVKQKGNTITKTEMDKYMKDKNLFSAGEIYDAYRKWLRSELKCKYYKSYQAVTAYKIDENLKISSPYEELQKMVGLEEIKRIVDEIIDSAKLQHIRSQMGMDTYQSSKHMLFTGNPGTAKTTVARLLAEILRYEGVLDISNCVECGRADLVGKYVGWTAPIIKNKFRMAKGGILFIDEAYSLVSKDSFGDEAITTIVQEMENHRDDVIVIFAGYPDKMKEFLDKNEGLRSRIAFQLHFPDYTAEELTDIMKLMIASKGYTASDEVYDICYDIFEKACKQKEFGNGRFVRNLLEQAEMAQSKRVMKENRGKKLSKKAILTLKPEDFNVNIAKGLKAEKRPIGFSVS